MKNKSMFKTSLLALALASVTSAYALPTMTIFDGTNTVTVTDGGVGDSSLGVNGVVLWNGTIGNWFINVNTGVTKPNFGSATDPYMDLAFVAGSTQAGILTITFSEDGFTYNGGLVDGWGGTTPTSPPGTVINQVAVNGQTVIQQGPLGPGAFSSTAGTNVILAPSDTLSLTVIINHTGAGLTTGNKNVQTPDGGSTVALLGLALGGVAAARRKFRI